jgi:hypothetical protein
MTNIATALAKAQEAIRKAGAQWIAGETSLSKLSDEARARLISARPTGPTPPGKPMLSPLPPLPAAFDWMNRDGKSCISAVKLQTDGSCTACASTDALESCAIRAGLADTGINLAERAIVGTPEACCGNLHGIAAFLQATGLPPERWFTSNAASALPGWRDETFKVVDWACYYPTSVDEVKALLINSGPVVTTMNATGEFMSFYKGGVYKNTNATSGGFHAILVLGYDDALQAFHCKNNWGTSWGESLDGQPWDKSPAGGGYFRISYSEFKAKVVNFGWDIHTYVGATPPPYFNAVQLGANQDGRLEAFMIGKDSKLYRRAQAQANGAWDIEKPLAGAALQLAVASNQDGRLEVFYVGTNTALFHNWQVKPNGAWSGESYFGGNAKRIALGRHQDGRLALFYVGMDDKLYRRAQTEPNSGWGSEAALGGLGKELAVASNQDGRLEVFYVGTNTALFHNWQVKPNGSWSGESYFGGNAKRIALGRNLDGRLELFYIGMDDRLYHRAQTAPNSGWGNEVALGGLAKELAVATNQDGRLELFYVGTNTALFHNWQVKPNGAWSGESYFGGNAKQMALGRHQDGRLQMLFLGVDDKLYQKAQTRPNSSWTEAAKL